MFFSLRIALASLTSHKLRTILAMLGIFLGALALTGVRHVSLSMVRMAEMETERLGPNLFMAAAGQSRFMRGPGGRGGFRVTTFKEADADALIWGIPGALRGTPYSASTMSMSFGGCSMSVQVVASRPNYAEIRLLNIAYGRFFNDTEESVRAAVCVLGNSVAERLFMIPETALGQRVRIGQSGLRVVGILAPMGSDISGTNQDEQVFMPLSTYLRRISNRDWVSGVYIQLAEDADEEMSKDSATRILRDRHKIGPDKPKTRDDFYVMTARDAMTLRIQSLDLVNTLGLISSSLSFAVGGLGILSIMVLLVRSRRLEIGIRRAIGARKSHIIRQFLMEAGIMSATGGLAGVICAMGLLAIIFQVIELPPVIDLSIILQAFLGSVALGLIAGAYPAAQAANIEILDVLRGQE